MIQLPAKYDAVRRDLALVVRMDEVKDIRNKAIALEVYAFQTKDGELIAHAVEIRERAIRRIGELMAEQREAGTLAKPPLITGPGRGKKEKRRVKIKTRGLSLPTQGVDKNLAHQARKAASMSEKDHEKTVKKRVERAKKAVEHSRQTKRVQSWSGEKEWYTPRQYLDAAVKVIGNIDLDPASSAKAQQHVKASRHFTAEDDGLKQAWTGNVFLNPPYAMPHIKDFTRKIVAAYLDGEIESGILLTNNATDTEWWGRALDAASAVCFTAGRIRFLEGENLTERTAPTNGQTFFYFGKNSERFAEVFSQFGRVIYSHKISWRNGKSQEQWSKMWSAPFPYPERL